MLYCLYHIENVNASFGPESKLIMLVCIITNPSQMLGVLSTIASNDTHWIRKRKPKRKRYVCHGPKASQLQCTNAPLQTTVSKMHENYAHHFWNTSQKMKL